MAIFNSYVSLPEGITPQKSRETVETWWKHQDFYCFLRCHSKILNHSSRWGNGHWYGYGNGMAIDTAMGGTAYCTFCVFWIPNFCRSNGSRYGSHLALSMLDYYYIIGVAVF